MIKITITGRGIYIMNKTKLDIVLQLEVAKDNLKNALTSLIEVNKGNNQFDYTTSGVLSEVFNDVNKLNTKLDNIIYQKGK